MSGKPIRIVVGFAAGGGNDVVARLLAPKMSAALGQPVIVENRTGANGAIGADVVAKSSPDGTSIYMGSSTSIVINPLIYKPLPFDMDRDLAPLTEVCSVNFMMLASKAAPFNTLPELLEYARAHPGKVTYASAGNGSTPHLAGELLNTMAGIKMTQIPYKGSAPMQLDLAAGHVDVTFDAVAQTLPNLQGGRVKSLALTGLKPNPLLPGVPTIDQFVKGYEVVNWYGMMVPAATPADVKKRLQQSVATAMQDKDVQASFAQMSIEAVGSTPAAFASFLKEETAKWAPVVKDIHLKIE